MNNKNQASENHIERSNFVRGLIQRPILKILAPNVPTKTVPKTIVQFWDNLEKLPKDVRQCIDTWKFTEKYGFERKLFDKQQARDFIYRNLGLRYKKAFDQCYHPAMQSDYFRLCYIFVSGGCYIDTDDVYW